MKFLGPESPFLHIKIVAFLLKFCNYDPLRQLRWSVLETRIPRFQEILFLGSPKQDLYSNSTVKHLVCNPRFLYLRNYGISPLILQKRPSQTTSCGSVQRYICTDFKKISFYWFQAKTATHPFLHLQNFVIFNQILKRTTHSLTCGGYF